MSETSKRDEGPLWVIRVGIAMSAFWSAIDNIRHWAGSPNIQALQQLVSDNSRTGRVKAKRKV